MGYLGSTEYIKFGNERHTGDMSQEAAMLSNNACEHSPGMPCRIDAK